MKTYRIEKKGKTFLFLEAANENDVHRYLPRKYGEDFFSMKIEESDPKEVSDHYKALDVKSWQEMGYSKEMAEAMAGSKATDEPVNEQMKANFMALGLSEAEATTAARGRENVEKIPFVSIDPQPVPPISKNSGNKLNERRTNLKG